MLILTRRTGQAINIGDDIVVSVGKIKGTQVQICIDAPLHISIQRDDMKKDSKNHIIKEPMEQDESARDGDLFEQEVAV